MINNLAEQEKFVCAPWKLYLCALKTLFVRLEIFAKTLTEIGNMQL